LNGGERVLALEVDVGVEFLGECRAANERRAREVGVESLAGGVDVVERGSLQVVVAEDGCGVRGGDRFGRH
jgi:hypothetical protein